MWATEPYGAGVGRGLPSEADRSGVTRAPFMRNRKGRSCLNGSREGSGAVQPGRAGTRRWPAMATMAGIGLGHNCHQQTIKNNEALNEVGLEGKREGSEAHIDLLNCAFIHSSHFLNRH